MKRLLYLSFALTTWYTTPVYGSDQRPNRIARKRSIKYDEATQAAIINNINTAQDNKEKIEHLEAEITELRRLTKYFMRQVNGHFQSNSRPFSVVMTPPVSPRAFPDSQNQIETPTRTDAYAAKIDQLSQNMKDTKGTLLTIQMTSLIGLILYELWKTQPWDSSSKKSPKKKREQLKNSKQRNKKVN